MHIDNLKEQAAQLGITEVLGQSPSGEMLISKDGDKKGKKVPKKGAEETKKTTKSGDKYKMLKKDVKERKKMLKKDIKERKKMEKELQELSGEISNMVNDFKQKMIKKAQLKSTSKIESSTDTIRTKDTKKRPETEIGKPPKPKVTEATEPVHRLNQSEFNKVFNRKVKNRNTSVDAKKKKGPDNAEVDAKGGSNTESSREGSSEKHEHIDQKQKILQEKEHRRIQEQRRTENDLEQIRMENFKARQEAKAKKAQMLRPSSGMKLSFNIPLQGPLEEFRILEEQKEKNEPKKIEEQYRMDEEHDDDSLEHIQEVIEENDSDKDETEKDINMINTKAEKMKEIKMKLIEKTQRIDEQISELEEIEENKEEIKNGSPGDPTKQIEGLLHSSSSDSEEMDSDNERLGEIASPETAEMRKLIERIKLLRHRCEAGIGNILFEKAYNLLKEEKDQGPEIVRKALIKIMGEENIGFYAIIDQILYLESFRTE